jgi:FKBP-type peptidyl-prolyl cis-trans isomerase
MDELCKSEDFVSGEWYEVGFHVDEVYNLYMQEEDPNVMEYKSIKLFLSFISSPNLYRYINGIWLKEIETASANTPKVQGEIVLDYKGFSLEGDSLDIPDYPLQFNTADQYQVIEGIEIALQHMHFGDSTMVIIPSYLAFGELGSKNGNVPPYEALLYYLKAYPAVEYYKEFQTKE